MHRAEDGKFAYKFHEAKTLCSFRLTQYALAFLEMKAKDYQVSRTDVIESWVRGEYDKEIILAALDRYIEEESQRDRKGNQYGKELKTDSERWDRFNKFKEWVKTSISAQVEGE